jgi:hypothetical protein
MNDLLAVGDKNQYTTLAERCERKRILPSTRCRWFDMDFKKWCVAVWAGCIHLEYGQLTGSDEHGSESLGYRKAGNIFIN